MVTHTSIPVLDQANTMSLLLENISKNYREPDGGSLPVLKIERFELVRGEQVALVGASGGGKPTLLNVLSAITTPDSGRVVIDDTVVTGMPE
ncbi:MAG: ATP-binding cassette domain-containing protein, partial [Planctomycetota bacterium]|nr:ATP-binding cassette domain-containing protein [Planctomycetota bacterium]